VENSKSELTSTLHLSSRENSTSPAGVLDDYLSSLSEQDRAVIATIQSSGGVKAMFLINRGESKGARFLITHEGATIGRSSSSGVFLDDVTVSRAHAVVEKKSTTFVLRDSGSLNGTYVNNESVSEISLKTGDQIQIGKFHLLFVCDHSKGK
jgi:pSer/pThr/pTyr-binding forkhead associated (FHA) protein